MRLWGLIVVLMAVLMIAGCGVNNNLPVNISAKGNSNAPVASESPRNSPPDDIRRVTVSELRDMLEQNKAVVVDVRGTDAYKQEHIKGALDIPENQLSSRTGELPKDKLIVFYCS